MFFRDHSRVSWRPALVEVSYVCPLAVPDLGIGFFFKKNLHEVRYS